MITFDPGTDFDFLATGETATVVIDYVVQDDDSTPYSVSAFRFIKDGLQATVWGWSSAFPSIRTWTARSSRPTGM